MTRSATALLTLLALLAALLSIMAWAARRTHNAADFAIAIVGSVRAGHAQLRGDRVNA